MKSSASTTRQVVARRSAAAAPSPVHGRGEHAAALRQIAALRESWRRTWKPEALPVEAQDVMSVLQRAGVEYVLIGAQAMVGWVDRPRNTLDVDVLIRKGHHRRAVNAIRRAYPTLVVEEADVVTRFTDPAIGHVVIDLMKPMHQLYQAVFEHAVIIGPNHRIPELEMMLACKFSAMVEPARDHLRRQQDAVDFGTMVKHNVARLDRDKLRKLAELLYAGAGDEALGYVGDVLAGRILLL